MKLKRVTKKIICFSLVSAMIAGDFLGGSVSDAASKKPELSEKKLTLYKGEKCVIKINNVSSKNLNKFTLKSSNKSVAVVKKKSSTKFTVTAKKNGKTTVTVATKLKKAVKGRKTYNLKVSVVVKKGNRPAKATATPEIVKKSVSTQEELTKVLNSINKTKIDTQLTLKSEEKKFEIPKGNYNNVSLTVDTPYADISNSGVFKSIEIVSIAKDTWTENAKGNVFVIDASAGRIVIPADAVIDQAIIKSNNSNFTIEVLGKVGNVILEGSSKVKLNVTGEVEKVEIKNKAVLDVKGTADIKLPVLISEGADGTSVTSNVALTLNTEATVAVKLDKGAEGSTIKSTNDKKKVEVDNNTNSVISYNTTG